MSSSDFTRSSISLTFSGFGFRLGFFEKEPDWCMWSCFSEAAKSTDSRQVGRIIKIWLELHNSPSAGTESEHLTIWNMDTESTLHPSHVKIKKNKISSQLVGSTT